MLKASYTEYNKEAVYNFEKMKSKGYSLFPSISMDDVGATLLLMFFILLPSECVSTL